MTEYVTAKDLERYKRRMGDFGRIYDTHGAGSAILDQVINMFDWKSNSAKSVERETQGSRKARRSRNLKSNDKNRHKRYVLWKLESHTLAKQCKLMR